MYGSRQNLTYLICIRVSTLYYVLNNLNTYFILVYHYTIMWRTYILFECLLFHYTCTLTHDIIQRYKHLCNYIDYIVFYCIHSMLSFYVLCVYRIHSEFHNMDSSHILPSKQSSACKYYKDDSKQNKIENNLSHDKVY